ncbi:MAG: hydantoinase/oxoprolinase family protein [Rhodospirillaceae bacterium]|nr:hydantoinase/oxoprolinase family protein [Rhodospirillaceae bacterium]
MPHRLGIDIGKTFTELLLLDDSGAAHALKVPNRPDDPVAAIAGGIRQLADKAGVAPGDIGTVVHGAPDLDPAATGSPDVGLLVTAGFEHVLHLARGQGPSPLAGRVVATLGITERMNAQGQVQQPIDEAGARSAIQTLRDMGAASIAVSLLHAATNPAHEQALKALAGEIAGDVPVTLSSDVVREAADYERTVAAVATAVLRPKLAGYFDSLADALRSRELSADLRIGRADGGSMSVDHAGEAPVDALNAGPAAGVAAAADAAARAGCRDALALDMGGGATTIGIVLDGAPVVTRKTPVAGANITLPSIAIAHAGAGGGAAARIVSHGALRVGPEAAAGGPACFGGDGPTLTDANLMLGLIPAASGHGPAPDRAAAETAIGRLADRLGVSPYHAAQGIRDLANEKLYGALRQTAAAQGVDIASMPLVAYGGAGPLHGNALAILCGDGPVIVPARPGMMSARGYVEAVPRQEFGHSCRCLLDDTNAAAVGQHLDALGARANAWLDEEHVPATTRQLRFEADVRCRGGGGDFALEIDPPSLSNWGLRDLADRFGTAFEQRHGVQLAEPVELVRLRAIAGGRPAGRRNGASRSGRARRTAGTGDPSGARIDENRLYLDGNFFSAPVYAADKLESGSRIAGPALVAGDGWTAAIHPGYVGVAEADGALVIAPDRSEEAAA